ncbi:hypothetical protein HDV03_002753 [Kappamyces sp. JEL0829]|nr:hypothetical protein HDV03_002753 [Kappamyces sp. JEL0829]
MEVDVNMDPLTANLRKLSATGLAENFEGFEFAKPASVPAAQFRENEGFFAVPKQGLKSIAGKGRQRSKSLSVQQQHHDTPFSSGGGGLVKPLSSVFHSTGVLSRKGRNAGTDDSKITPETPIKHKRVLGSIWNGHDGPITAGSLLGPSTGQSVKAPGLASTSIDTPLFIRQKQLNLNSGKNTPFLSSVSKPPHIPMSTAASPFDLRFGNGLPVTPSSHASLKNNRLHRSPLKETPTKNVKRPHLNPRDDSPSEGAGLHIALANPSFSQGPPEVLMAPSTNQVPSVGVTPFPSRSHQKDVFQDSPRSVFTLDSPSAAKVSELSPMPGTLADSPMQPPSRPDFDMQQQSPVVAPKEFFSRLVKERKVPAAPSHPLPFQALVSRYRQVVNRDFLDALEGTQPGLDATLALLAKRPPEDLAVPILDYFESRFEIMGRLGHGEFADAYHVHSLEDGRQYAIKKTRHPFLGFKDAVAKLNEVKMLLAVQNYPYCLCISDAWIQYGYIYIQTELCSRGSLSKYLEEYCSETPLTEDQIWRILADITQGLNHIHQRGIVHLDIKPGNIFITQSGHLKIGDFGLATVPPVVNGDLEGDRTYLAPEFLHSSTVSYPADIFRYAVVC